ncbi:unnamed protein product [marine sediment metagenome]|uniref:Uncharacterized protein n=1 Tax=marine sediment metagenome TaxID=412755 RepID=X1KR46_9ZZZZ
MAKRRRKSARRAYSKARRGGYTSRKAGMGAVINNVLDGLMVGGVQSFVPNDALGGFADTLAPIGVGWFRKNDTLMTIGGYQLGIKLAQKYGGATGAATGGGAY